jgi:hypothetical protein
MSKPKERESDQVFVLRCWRETRGDAATDDNGWRVRISDVTLQKRRYVYGLDAAFQLIRRRLASAFGRSSGEDRSQ